MVIQAQHWNLCRSSTCKLFLLKEVEALTTELQRVKEEKAQALNDEKLAASSVQALLEEKTFLLNIKRYIFY